jgi:hypothetical protein
MTSVRIRPTSGPQLATPRQRKAQMSVEEAREAPRAGTPAGYYAGSPVATMNAEPARRDGVV